MQQQKKNAVKTKSQASEIDVAVKWTGTVHIHDAMVAGTVKCGEFSTGTKM